VGNTADNSVGTATTADITAATSHADTSAAASLAFFYDPSSDTLLCAVVEFVSDEYKGFFTSADVAVGSAGVSEVRWATASDSADATALEALAIAHSAEEVNGCLDATPVATEATNPRLGTNHEFATSRTSSDTSEADESVEHLGGLPNAVTDTSCFPGRTSASAGSSHNSSSCDALATDQAFGGGDDSETSADAESSHGLLRSTSWCNIPCGRPSNTALSSEHSVVLDQIFAVVPAAHDASAGSLSAATATGGGFDTTDASESVENVVDVSRHSFAGSSVAASADISSPSAWARSRDTACGLLACAILSDVLDPSHNIFPSSA